MKLSSKTVRMSRSTEGRNARKNMVVRGRAGTARAALFEPDVVLTGRRFRRANGLTRTQGALFDALTGLSVGDPGRPVASIDVGDGIRVITGLHGV